MRSIELTPYSRAEIARRIIDAKTGPEAITAALAMSLYSQAQLSKASGLNPDTITALKRGKKPTRAQKAALAWAIASL